MQQLGRGEYGGPRIVADIGMSCKKFQDVQLLQFKEFIRNVDHSIYRSLIFCEEARNRVAVHQGN